jgi:hypothetical protein
MQSLLRVLLCLALSAGAVFAQTDRGTITGTIADPAGAVIPGATVQGRNSETGAQYEAASTSTGNYTLAQLPAGVYQLTASVSGFKQYVRTGITVMVAQTLRIDLALEVGAVTETVTVNADATLLRTESGELSHNVTSDRLGALPMIGFTSTIRDPYAVTQLIPGTLFQERTYVRVNGSPANTQGLRIEGQDATNSMRLSQTAQNQASVEAIEEFAVQTSNYAAEYGQAGGGFFNVTMKSGTNAFHGSAYDYLSNEALNAGLPFTYGQTKPNQLTRPAVRRHDYGFTLGGPAWIPKVYDGHSRTFFFFSFEQFREIAVNTSSFTVPSLSYRAGDFSQALTGKNLCPTANPNCDPLGRPIMENTIYNPANLTTAPNGQQVRNPFMGCDGQHPNVICTTPGNANYYQFDPVAVKIQNLIPLPTNSNLTNNYLVPWNSSNIRTIPALKIDHNLSARSKLSFYWSPTYVYAVDSTGANAGDGFATAATSQRGSHGSTNMERLNFDQTLTPTMLFHFGVGLQIFRWGDDVKDKSFDQLKELGLRGASVTIFPYITNLCLTTACASPGGMKNMGPNMQSVETMIKPTANTSLTWVKSNHTFKFGAEMRLEGYPTQVLNPAYGFYNFSPEQTGLPSTNGQNLQGGSVGFPYASFLTGRVHDGNIGVVSSPRLGKSAWALFAQDSWKVTRRLTLDYGLRWDYQGYYRDTYGRIANFSPTTPNPTAGGRLGAVIFEGDGPGHCNCDFARVYPYAFGPRWGAAYQIANKTVLRAGGGISYGQTATENRISTAVASSNLYSSPSFGDAAILLRDGPPTPAPWPNLNAGQYPLTGTLTAPPNAFDRNAGRPPRMMQWSISIQREIFKNLAIEAAYVGNRGAWWEGNELINLNALTPERIASFGLDINNAADRTLLTSTLNSSLATQRGFNKPPYPGFPTTSTVAQSLRPFPQFAATSSATPAINYLWAPLGRTWYDSLQLKATKRFSHGLDFTSVFTWQKELTMGAEVAGGLGGSGASVNDVFDRPSNKHISSLSRPFVSVLAINYRSPIWGSNRVLSGAVRDWTIGAVLQYASGMPILAPTAQSALSSLLFRNTFAQRVPGQPLFTQDLNCKSCYDPVKDFVLNKNAWVDPAAGQFGASSIYYNDYRYQRRPSESLSIGRIFRIKEGVSVNIRADFQNVLNRLVIGNPTATNAKATQTSNATTGETTGGFGDINTSAGAGTAPRTGLIVARILF